MGVPVTQTDQSNRFNEEELKALRVHGREVAYQAGRMIVRRGDTGQRFYVVTAGEVHVVLGEKGSQLCLARLGRGASFGEMSLLTRSPVSADVVAQNDATLLELSAESFQKALEASSPLRNHVLARLSKSLLSTSSAAWNLFQNTEALTALMKASEGKAGPVIAESASMRRAQIQIVQLSDEDGPVLITGEPGTGASFAAKKIHKPHGDRDGDGDTPFLIIDCTDLEEGQASRTLFGAMQTRDFVKRPSDSNIEDLEYRGTLDLADKGSLVLLNVNALDEHSQAMLAEYLEKYTGDEEVVPRTRVMLTMEESLDSALESGRLLESLARAVSDSILKMPPLRNRKQDILPLARLFLAEHSPEDGEPKRGFSQAAERILLSAQYRHGNVQELREAVEFAVLIADAHEIDSRHIFIGPKSQAHTFELDLRQSKFVEQFVRGPFIRYARGGVFLFFLACAMLCLVLADAPAGRVANILVWGVWWPLLMLLFLLLGRVWCIFCPISSAGSLARKVRSFGLGLPKWIERRADWLMAFLFLSILWFEHVFDMTREPFATGLLLLSLMLASAICSIFYEREVWCRYLCPLGSIGAGYSVSSMVHLRATPGICSTKCKTHECLKGSAEAPGCPMFHHPLFVREAHFCKLCLTCLRTCPHDSPRPVIRPLLQGIWRLDSLSDSLIPVAFVELLVGLVMLASRSAQWGESVLGFSIMSALVLGVAFLMTRALPRLICKDDNRTLTARVAFALLILGWGPFMAFHVQHIPGLKAIRIYATSETGILAGANLPEITLLMVSQIAIIAMAAMFAAIVLWRVRVYAIRNSAELTRLGWGILGVICTLYVGVALVLATLPHLHP